MKEQKFEKVELKNVITDEGMKNLTVELVPFNYRNDDHVRFAYNIGDMYQRLPSAFRDLSDAAHRFVELFVVHTEEDAQNVNSVYSIVQNDTRACRTLLNNVKFQKDITDFFVNA